MTLKDFLLLICTILVLYGLAWLATDPRYWDRPTISDVYLGNHQ